MDDALKVKCLDSLCDTPKIFSDLSALSMCISKRIKWILKKSHREKKIFFIFLKSSHQVDMKNVDECPRESIAYFNALETRGDHIIFLISLLKVLKSPTKKVKYKLIFEQCG